MKLKKNNFYSDIKLILDNARNNAIRAVNFSMVVAYWEIGKRIVEEDQGGNKRAEYGKKILIELSEKLSLDFGKGFSVQNLENFRNFYLAFSIKSDAVSRNSKYENVINNLRPELSWTHYRLLMRVENLNARKYYIKESIEQNWSTRVLERQINSLYYERLLSSKNKKPLIDKTIKDSKGDKPDILDFVKDPYVLEFLSLNPSATLYEKDLESELIDKIQLFLLELGRGFSFVARQKRISAEDDHFYIDLVFYNYVLKCFILIDLKVGKLTHEDIGQMDFYLRYYEENIKQQTDNPTIGLILCTEKNETVVKYSILKGHKQLFASKYKLYLPSEKELIKELQSEINSLNQKTKIK